MSRDAPAPVEYSLAGIRAALERIADALEQDADDRRSRENADHHAVMEDGEMRETYGGGS